MLSKVDILTGVVPPDDLPLPPALAEALARRDTSEVAPHFTNRLRRADRILRRFPGWVRRAAITFGFRYTVPFFGAARAHIEEVSDLEVVVRVADRRQVRNHVEGVHAVAMALSAETATGLLVAMNLQDRVVPLLVRMNIHYVHRSNGDLTARAHITPAQAETLQSTHRGQMTIAVEVTDEAGAMPIECEMVWAWRQLGPKAPKRSRHRHHPGARLEAGRPPTSRPPDDSDIG